MCKKIHKFSNFFAITKKSLKNFPNTKFLPSSSTTSNQVTKSHGTRVGTFAGFRHFSSLTSTTQRFSQICLVQKVGASLLARKLTTKKQKTQELKGVRTQDFLFVEFC
jgi:hypothetical protein